MIHLTLRISLVFCLLIISSCSTIYITGRDFDESKVNSLAVGETTQAEVLQMFGDPYDQGLVNEYTVFVYSYEENEFPATSGRRINIDKEHKSLMILFDESNHVKFFTHNVPLSFSNLEAMILHEERKTRQQNNENYNNY